VRDAVHGDFQRDGDLLLDLLGGAAGPLCNHLDIIVGDVGIGLDGQRTKCDDAPDEKNGSQRQDEQTFAECGIDDSLNHCLFAVPKSAISSAESLAAGERLWPG
jgi:hypothetical protein